MGILDPISEKKTEPLGTRVAPPSFGTEIVPQEAGRCQSEHLPENGVLGVESPRLPSGDAIASDAGIHPANEVSQYRRDVHDLLSRLDPVAAFRYIHCLEEGRGFFYHCPVNDEHYSTYIPFTCMQRICPQCSDYLAGKVREKYGPVISNVTKYNPRGWSLKLGVLTRSVALEDGLGITARETLDACRNLYHELWGKDKGAGMIASLEVGERGQKFHAHIIVWGRFVWHSERAERLHKWRDSARCKIACLFLLAAGMPLEAMYLYNYPAPHVKTSGGPYLMETWEKLTGDRVVWIEKTTPDRAVREGLKYVTKFINLKPDQLVSLHLALKGTRRLRTFGCFYNPKINEEEEQETNVTKCPDCGCPLKYTPELLFELWRAESAAMRRAEEMNTLQHLTLSLHSLLNSTESNKSPPATGPPRQISLDLQLETAIHGESRARSGENNEGS